MADRLHALPDVLDELDVTRAREAVLVDHLGRGGEPGLPFVPDASDAAGALVSSLGYWTWQLASARQVLWSVPSSPPGVASWLAHRLDWLRATETAATAYCELVAAMDRAWRVVDRPACRTRVPVGPCPEQVDARACPGTVVAYVPVREVEPAVMRCTNLDCDRHDEPWTPDQWRRAGIRILRRAAVVTRSDGDYTHRQQANRSP